MDILFIISGAFCLIEAVMLFMGKDFLIFTGGAIKKEDYNLPDLYKAEAPWFLVDGLLCLALGIVDLSIVIELVCIGAVFITLVVHWNILKNEKFRK